MRANWELPFRLSKYNCQSLFLGLTRQPNCTLIRLYAYLDQNYGHFALWSFHPWSLCSNQKSVSSIIKVTSLHKKVILLHVRNQWNIVLMLELDWFWTYISSDLLTKKSSFQSHSLTLGNMKYHFIWLLSSTQILIHCNSSKPLLLHGRNTRRCPC